MSVLYWLAIAAVGAGYWLAVDWVIRNRWIFRHRRDMLGGAW